MQTSSMADRLKQVADRITFASMNYRIWWIYTEPGVRAVIRDQCKDLPSQSPSLAPPCLGSRSAARRAVPFTSVTKSFAEPDGDLICQKGDFCCAAFLRSC